ncbi:hypothetical protein [Herbiconiux sp.]|uniref:hypothetical protein n=1 Tax=Herbiconiux sp. TaxID=1871186 RepID=UPI0025BC4465|nr:hypothetical protein [Herbiconiux sp.]
MIPSLRRDLPRMAFGHRVGIDVKVFAEVPSVAGVPDLAGVRFDARAIQARREGEVRPLATEAEVKAVLAITSGPLQIGELARRIRRSPDYVRRAVVPLLIQQGWVTEVDGLVRRRGEARWIAQRVVTVEAKLRDWTKAIGQARRQQMSADAAYIALDASGMRSITPHLDRVAEGGVGVIAVDSQSQRSRVLVRPRRIQPERTLVGRMLIAERCLEMWGRGQMNGQIYPVFGWTVPELTQD